MRENNGDVEDMTDKQKDVCCTNGGLFHKPPRCDTTQLFG